ncbi:GspE/PulE family protein [Sedimentisphaera salicampi]|uniref:GspE/PulE family protein n=1 Tax=Sedimentisphaera salicampi TaxID=1941349 RepID=UPI000B9A9D8F|nr:ATPase, T2SS/T4P/T4SS family [Sedimentisphaera salicampi]OXU14403.1 Type II traffic warden ATPase [Sedimentisphaera salicampi]
MSFLSQKLKEKSLISESQALAVDESISKNNTILGAVSSNTDLDEPSLLEAIADIIGCRYLSSLESLLPSRDMLAKFPARLLLEHCIAPVEIDERLHIAVNDPFNSRGIDQVRISTGLDCPIALCCRSDIDRFIKTHLGLGADTIQTMVDEAESSGLTILSEIEQQDIDLEDEAEGASIIRFVNQLLTEAIEKRATDVHIEPFEDELRVRYRVDGVLQGASVPPEVKQFQAAIVSRIKILSNLDIAEKRVPQDGRIKVLLSGKEVDIRVSIIPMLYGEAVVLRLLDCSSMLLGLENIGMNRDDRKIFSDVITKPHGIILVTGPTGSGKTTTLYAALSKINDLERKIITIEDPIEYQLYGVNQIQVSNKRGLTFAAGLRSILRHDPDVILVGEIRDLETARIAVQSSLTGHLVFSTLHTNDASGALTRLVDMGVEPYLVASSLEAVLAQRLLRKICPYCREEIDKDEANALRDKYGEIIPETLYKGAGCRNCQGTGYRGRAGIFEQLVVSDDIRALLMDNASVTDIKKQAKKEGMRTLREDVQRYLDAGETTVEEMLRVTKV